MLTGGQHWCSVQIAQGPLFPTLCPALLCCGPAWTTSKSPAGFSVAALYQPTPHLPQRTPSPPCLALHLGVLAPDTLKPERRP